MSNKTFFTYEQQMEKLTKEKQLVISDTEFAKDTLQKLSYFSLIGGYKDFSNTSHLENICMVLHLKKLLLFTISMRNCEHSSSNTSYT